MVGSVGKDKEFGITSNWILISPLPLTNYIANSLRKSAEALLKINVRDLFKGLGVCELGTQLGNNPEVFQKDRKVNSHYREKRLLENDQSCTGSPGHGPGWSLVTLDGREDGRQCWRCSDALDVRWGYM